MLFHQRRPNHGHGCRRFHHKGLAYASFRSESRHYPGEGGPILRDATCCAYLLWSTRAVDVPGGVDRISRCFSSMLETCWTKCDRMLETLQDSAEQDMDVHRRLLSIEDYYRYNHI